MTDKEYQKKLDEIVDGNYRKQGERVNIERLVEIAKDLDRLEAETNGKDQLARVHGE